MRLVEFSTVENVRTANRPIRTPLWVWLIVVGLALIEPVTHLWIAFGLPDGSVPTGLHIPDTICFRVFMDMFESGFHSPHATCQAPQGSQYIGYFAVPYYWLYGALGLVGHVLQLNDFLLLGFGNGLVAFLYLWVVYRFLVHAAPRYANLAFIFFTLGGGLGGVLYVLTGLLGMHGATGFEENFARHALYELIEGPVLSPVLHFPRLYYGVAFVLCYGSLTQLIKASRSGARRHAVFAAILLVIASFINTRFGALAWVVAMFYLYTQEDIENRLRFRAAVTMTIAVGLGIVAGLLMLGLNPSIVGTTVSTVRQAMWLFPFLSATFFFLLLVPNEIRRSLPRMPLLGRACSWGAVGYLGVFALLYVGHQVYWGNYLKGGEPDAALFSSDKALIGAVAGFIFGMTRRERGRQPDPELSWVVLWLLSFLAVAVSTWGNGWFLGFSPQRCMAMLGVPIALLAARGATRLHSHRPFVARAIVSTIIACGVTSVAVGSLCFQGPLFHEPGKDPFAWHHTEAMTETDASLLDALGAGVVLAPKPISDVIALRPGNSVLFGAATGHADQLYETMKEGVQRFFDPNTANEYRRVFLSEWCVDYVYCPDTFPVHPDTLAELIGMQELEVVGREGDAVLFRRVE